METIYAEYQDWMKDQVVDMFCEQYGNERKQFSDYFDAFYGSIQKEKSIRFVILNGKEVAGFVSFSHWPYWINGKLANSYQCGNVIINKNYRGQGLYNKLLDYLDANAAKYNIDFIVGFPIKEILKLYIKAGWKNPFNLNWYVKVFNPAGKLFPVSEQSLGRVFSGEKKYVQSIPVSGKNHVNISEEFYHWNREYNNLAKHFYFVYEEASHFVEFSLKLNKRKYLNELIIGEINTNATDAAFVVRGLKKLRSKRFRLPGISICSICLNTFNSDVVLKAIEITGFKKIEKDIKFIIKNIKWNESELTDPEKWLLYRRDIDTW